MFIQYIVAHLERFRQLQNELVVTARAPIFQHQLIELFRVVASRLYQSVNDVRFERVFRNIVGFVAQLLAYFFELVRVFVRGNE